MSKAVSLVLCLYLLALSGCEIKPRKQRDLETHIKELVRRRAPAEEIIAKLGQPKHTYTRQEVMDYKAKTPKHDGAVQKTWTLLSQYPETLYYPGPPTYENYIFLDSGRKAVGFHFAAE